MPDTITSTEVRAFIVAMKRCNRTPWSEGRQEGRCGMTKQRKRKRARNGEGKSQRKRQRDYIPTTVPFAATPRGETPSIDEWAHPAVWTDRMLTTLLEGAVRGGKWHNWPNVYFTDHGFRSLREAHTRFVQSLEGPY